MDERIPARDPGREEPVIEGGSVEALDELPFHEARHRADTARMLAFVLVGILGGSLLLHYAMVVVLVVLGRDAALQSLGQIFNVWLPVIASLVSSAVTYYFTRERT